MNNYFTGDSILVDFMENNENLKKLMEENSSLKLQIEKKEKMFFNEKFDLSMKISNYENEVVKLKKLINSANETIEVYKVINKNQDNNEVKLMFERLEKEKTEMNQLNAYLKKENSEFLQKLHVVINKVKELNENNYLDIKMTLEEDIFKKLNKSENRDSKKNLLILYSTNHHSYINTDNNNNYNCINNLPSSEYINENVKGELNSINFESTNKHIDEKIKINKENIPPSNIKDKEQYSEPQLSIENGLNDSNITSPDISFTSKNTNEIKEIFITLKKDKKEFYENAVNIITDNEIEIRNLKYELEDLKSTVTNYEKEIYEIENFLLKKYNISISNLFESKISFLEEATDKRLNFFSTNNENSKILLENENNDVESNSQSFNNQKMKNSDIVINKALSKSKENGLKDANSAKILLSASKHNNTGENESSIKMSIKNKVLENFANYLPEEEFAFSNKQIMDEKIICNENFKDTLSDSKESDNIIKYLENKLYETKRDYEEKLKKLSQDMENIDIEKNFYIQELETIKSNKRVLVDDLEFYSSTLRSVQDQKEKLEDTLKNKIDILVSENKQLEQLVLKNSDQILLLEKERKQLRDKYTTDITQLKDKQAKEKETIEIRAGELNLRYLECHKEKECLKKENENLKQMLEKKKKEIEELIEIKKQKKEKNKTKFYNINEKFKITIDRLKAESFNNISNLQGKLRRIYSFMENYININKNNPQKLETCDLLIGNKLKRSKTISKIKNKNNYIFDFLDFHQAFEYGNKCEDDDNIVIKVNDDLLNKLFIDTNVVGSSDTNSESLKLEGFKAKFDYKDIKNLVMNRKKSHAIEIKEMYGLETKIKSEVVKEKINKNNEVNDKNIEETIKNENQNPKQITLSDALEVDNKKAGKIMVNKICSKKTRDSIKTKNLKRSSKYNLMKNLTKLKLKGYNKEKPYEIEKGINIYNRFQNSDPKPADLKENMLLIKNLEDEILILKQENKNLCEEIKLLQNDVLNMEHLKNEYIKKLTSDLEKTEEEAAKVKLSMYQLSFEKESEILNIKNYCKKLKISLKALEEQNKVLSQNFSDLNNKMMLSFRKK